ncbi:MAG: hypothetical protein CFH15_00053 [Alphaproteobacteria bacterium MarineAlpha5_Bin5]|nr:MAG: hypothetical protein CFH15_00053 [Alphaproteobacteria bacterium MarineAlpha5_Bin5]|tara:strand:- start:4210 stop:4371 length:162 start_codon:yes stop_codon:yes gene_type:complete
MIKKLLNYLNKSLRSDSKIEIIEKYLSKSSNIYDLEERIRDLERSGIYNNLYN